MNETQTTDNRMIIIGAFIIVIIFVVIIAFVGSNILGQNSTTPTPTPTTTTTITFTPTPSVSITLPPDVDASEAFSPGNNCCNKSDYHTCSTDPEWIQGFYDCNDAKCAACENDGVSGSTCNNNLVCNPGEQHVNCPSDCDEGGFSELTSGSTCSPTNADNGKDDCDGDTLVCLRCPGNSNNPSNGACGVGTFASTSSNTQFINQHCGGIASGAPVITTTILPDTAIGEDNVLNILLGLVLIVFGIIILKAIQQLKLANND